MNQPLQHMQVQYTVSDAISGNKQAISALVKQWYKRIYNFCYRYFYDHTLATEATQQTFIIMYQKVHTLRDPALFKNWLYRIAGNQCHEESRRQKRNPTISFLHIPEEQRDWPEAKGSLRNPDRQYHNRELGELLFEIIAELPVDQRIVVIMKEYEGFRFREIAETLDIPENTAKSRLYYGLRSLKKALEERNLDMKTLLGS
jgi:RNA polymerase sigma-70 factor (ECF subfamily)